jgi:uncharacterized protein (DUF2141 family)
MLAPLLAALRAASSAQAGEADLVFSFSGLADSGAVMLALYDSEASYRKRTPALLTRKAPVRAGAAEVRVEGLKPGPYAAMIFHDVNGDGRMNFNALRLPQEPYAFSNNARGLPLASWPAAVFRAGPGETRQVIRMK